jgi:hypothetical protein
MGLSHLLQPLHDLNVVSTRVGHCTVNASVKSGMPYMGNKIVYVDQELNISLKVHLLAGIIV